MNGYNNDFRADPWSFVRRFAVNSLSFRLSGQTVYTSEVRHLAGTFDTNKVGEFDIEPVRAMTSMQLYLRGFIPGHAQFGVASTATHLVDAPISAYWCPYLAIGSQGKALGNVPFVDLPKHNPPRTIMLTGAMNGCSLVVTESPINHSHFRVYHDSAHGKDTFKDCKVYLRINYHDEGYAATNTTVSSAEPRAVAAPATPAAGRGRASSMSGPKTAPKAPIAAPARARSGSVGEAPANKPPIEFSYGDMAQFDSMAGGAARSATVGIATVIPTSFNFLYYDQTDACWYAVSQPQNTLPAAPAPVVKPPEGRMARLLFDKEAELNKVMRAYRSDMERAPNPIEASRARPPWRQAIPTF